MLRDVFGFAEQQGKAMYGRGCELAIIRKKNTAVLNKAEAIADARIVSIIVDWYLPHNTPSKQQHALLSKQ